MGGLSMETGKATRPKADKKICLECLEYHPLESFSKARPSMCKYCYAKSMREKRAKNKQKANEPKPFDWDAYRAEALLRVHCARLSGYWANPNDQIGPPEITRSIGIADEIIAELKKQP